MTFRLYPTDTHGTIANTAMPDVLTFLAKGAGRPSRAQHLLRPQATLL
jgi:hypothetical protein